MGNLFLILLGLGNLFLILLGFGFLNTFVKNKVVFGLLWARAGPSLKGVRQLPKAPKILEKNLLN